MTDIRERLTDALKEAAYPAYFGGGTVAQSQCGTVLPIEVALDVLLSLPGIAIVDSREMAQLRLNLTIEKNRARLEQSIRDGEAQLASGRDLPTLDDLAEDAAAAAVQAQEEQQCR